MFFMELKYQNIYTHLINQSPVLTIHHKLSFTLNVNYSCLDIQHVMCMVLGKLNKYFESGPVHETERLCVVSRAAKGEWHAKHAEVFLTRIILVHSPSCEHWASFYKFTCSPEALFVKTMSTLLFWNMTVGYYEFNST